jgi:molybdopterin-guanine dinucleotide biosynthesis protein A
MGRDKALLELGGVPMIVRIMRVVEPMVSSVAVVGPHGRYGSLGLRVVPDRWPGAGPLGGIVTSLSTSSADWNLILSCDLPFLTAEWIDWLISRAQGSLAQAVVPESRQGLEPLAAMYRKDCRPAFAAAFERGVRGVSEALAGVVIDRVAADQWQAAGHAEALLQNVNTADDFVEAQRRVARGP